MLESENLADLVFFQMKLGTYWKVFLKELKIPYPKFPLYQNC